MSPRAFLYDKLAALRILPLLDAIGREIEEREAAIARLLAELATLDRRGKGWSREADLLTADLAIQKREFRHAQGELERLGCTLVGTHPPTIRIPGIEHSWLWQTGRGIPEGATALEEGAWTDGGA
jgi:hypothetical protein